MVKLVVSPLPPYCLYLSQNLDTHNYVWLLRHAPYFARSAGGVISVELLPTLEKALQAISACVSNTLALYVLIVLIARQMLRQFPDAVLRREIGIFRFARRERGLPLVTSLKAMWRPFKALSALLDLHDENVDCHVWHPFKAMWRDLLRHCRHF